MWPGKYSPFGINDADVYVVGLKDSASSTAPRALWTRFQYLTKPRQRIRIVQGLTVA